MFYARESHLSSHAKATIIRAVYCFLEYILKWSTFDNAYTLQTVSFSYNFFFLRV